VKGQEASVVGSALTLDPAIDWIVPTYRELPALVRHGYPLERILAGSMGKAASGRIPDGVNVLPNQVALAPQLQHAVGLAWGLMIQRKPGVVMAYCGEGAASEGDFHEACNLAGVRRAPIVFALMNNQWAISTSREAQSAGEFYRRAEGYGFPGVQVDGNDLMAVWDAASEAVERARRGEGPTLIDCVTYRLSFHNTTDNPQAYLPEGWVERAEREDPIQRIQAYLAARGLWDEAARQAMEGEIAEQIDAAVHAATAMPAARPEDVFANTYADLPPRVRRQRDELARLTGG
jgi:pyruvate dehydrogenase E1 component alpha subunit